MLNAYIDLKNITYQIELKNQTKLLTLTKEGILMKCNTFTGTTF